jgi:hypothetical protein
MTILIATFLFFVLSIGLLAAATTVARRRSRAGCAQRGACSSMGLSCTGTKVPNASAERCGQAECSP